jgi:hypothetical protein
MAPNGNPESFLCLDAFLTAGRDPVNTRAVLSRIVRGNAEDSLSY